VLEEQPLIHAESAGFERFFREFEPVLSRALAAGFGFEVGREAAAEAMARAWQRWREVSTMDNPHGYVYRIAERIAIRDRRSRDVFAPAPPLAGQLFEPALGPALNRLSVRQRQAVVLVAAYGLTHSEAAGLLGIRASSIQNHLERGMAKLKRSLGAEHDD
jgi:DNA-directed RNA polymerase specialized sigma24 family protein